MKDVHCPSGGDIRLVLIPPQGGQGGLSSPLPGETAEFYLLSPQGRERTVHVSPQGARREFMCSSCRGRRKSFTSLSPRGTYAGLLLSPPGDTRLSSFSPQGRRMFLFPSLPGEGRVLLLSPPGGRKSFYFSLPRGQSRLSSFLSQGTSTESSLLGPWQRRETCFLSFLPLAGTIKDLLS